MSPGPEIAEKSPDRMAEASTESVQDPTAALTTSTAVTVRTAPPTALRLTTAVQVRRTPFRTCVTMLSGHTHPSIHPSHTGNEAQKGKGER